MAEDRGHLTIDLDASLSRRYDKLLHAFADQERSTKAIETTLNDMLSTIETQMRPFFQWANYPFPLADEKEGEKTVGERLNEFVDELHAVLALRFPHLVE